MYVVMLTRSGGVVGEVIPSYPGSPESDHGLRDRSQPPVRKVQVRDVSRTPLPPLSTIPPVSFTS
jgi:hypothetical protein